jgi:hypothetical protein
VCRFHLICCFFTIRLATIPWTADSTNPVEIRRPEPPEAVCRAVAKDIVDEHFLHASAASLREQAAGPGAWDQIRSREAIVAARIRIEHIDYLE